MKILLNSYIKLLTVVLCLFCFTAKAELEECKDEVFDTSLVDVTLPKIDIPAVAHSDGMTISFSRRRCTALPYYRYELLATVTPTEPGKSILEAYKFYGVQGESEEHMSFYKIPSQLTTKEQFTVDTSTTQSGYKPLDHLFIDLDKSFTLEMRCKATFRGHCEDKKLFFSNFTEKKDNITQISNLSNVTGTWYDPTYDGSGFNVAETTIGLIMYFYGYKSSPDAQPLWLMSDIGEKEVKKGQSMTLKLYSSAANNGANFNTKPQNSPGISEWGSATVKFNSCTTDIIILDGKDGKITHNIVKLANIKGITCTE